MATKTLEPIYTFCFMDAIHYKVRDEGRMCNRAAYVVIVLMLRDIKTYWVYGLEKMNHQNSGLV